MGAFFIEKINTESRLSRKELFCKMALSDNIRIKTKAHSFEFFYSSSLEENIFIKFGNDHIFRIGCMIYKKMSTEDSLVTFFKDYKNNAVEYDKLLGQFLLIVVNSESIKIISDCSGIMNLYADRSLNTISSSFLALCYSKKQLTINKQPLIENLLTGAVIGPDTIFQEIIRLDSQHERSTLDIGLSFLTKPVFESLSRTREDAIEEQVEHLDDYFSSLKATADSLGVVIGLTGGFDSRLIMSFAEKHFSNIEYYSHWRNSPSLEFNIAEKLASSVSKQLRSYKVVEPLKMTTENALNTLEKGYYHCDGHIRTQLYWHESYNNMDYVKQVYGKNRLGLHGIGGEQYRNYERMIWPKWNYWSWLKYEVLFRYSDHLFHSKKMEEEFIKWYASKINYKLHRSIKDYSPINALMLKKFHNEVYNLSNRNSRSNSENRIANLLSPFADGHVSTKSYNAVPYLGNSLSFQADMIKRIDPKLAEIESDYGFDFYTGENFQSKTSGYIKELLPKNIFYTLYHKRKNTRNDPFYLNYKDQYTFIKDFEDLITKLDINIDIDKLKSVKDTGWQLISLGYLLFKLKDKISFTE